jgi:hypothetical protein
MNCKAHLMIVMQNDKIDYCIMRRNQNDRVEGIYNNAIISYSGKKIDNLTSILYNGKLFEWNKMGDKNKSINHTRTWKKHSRDMRKITNECRQLTKKAKKK